MKKIKSFIALFLLAVVAVVLVPKAFAVITNTTKGTIDLSGIKEAVQVKAYRVMDVHIAEYEDSNKNAPQAPVYTWTSEVATWVANFEKNGEKVYAKYIDTKNNNAVTEAFNDEDLTNTKDLADFYDDLAAAIKGGEITISNDNTKTLQASGTGSDKIENAEMGNYLIIIENGQKYTYNPSTVNVVPEYKNGAWNVSTPNKAVIKFTEPTIEKVTTDDATETDAKIGDVIPYTITVDVPNYKKDAVAKTITIKDTLSNGLTFNGTAADKFKVYGVKGTTKKLLTEGTNYSIDTTGSETFKVVFNTTQYEDTFRLTEVELKYDQIVVEYSATVNENAINGLDKTTNKAILEWNNDPTSDSTVETDPSIVKVFTYNIKVNKVDGDNNNAPLAGAKFSVKKGNTKLNFVLVSAGVYRLATDDDETTTDLLEVASDGTLVVKGLDLGTYTVTEEEAPAGYVKLQNPRDFEITDEDLDGNIEITNEDGETEELTVNTLEDTIVNTHGSTLPVTGGIGTLIFSIVGIVFMGIGAFLIKNILKKKEVQNI